MLAMSQLAIRRTFFVSETDFQHELAVELQKQQLDVILELPVRVPVMNTIHVDIVVYDRNAGIYHPIELKYKTKSDICKGQLGMPQYKLRTHSAQDVNRYLFWKDVYRIEHTTCIKGFGEGFVIMLTNDDNYWNKPVSNNSIDILFRLNSGNTVKTVMWNVGNSSGNYYVGRVHYDAFVLKRPYRIPKWRLFSNSYSLKNNNNCFKYLILTVPQMVPSSVNNQGGLFQIGE